MKTDDVTRLEVIDYNNSPETNGKWPRDVVKYNIENCELQLQDGGKTLKIFLNSK